MEDQQTNNAANPDRMSTLVECLNKVNADGYTENFSVRNHQLYHGAADQYFEAKDTHIINFYRFEGASNPEDMDILYAIRTSNGLMGTLTDAYGPYANSGVNEFILRVHDIHKKEPE